MTSTNVLELNFADDLGKKKKITIKNPIEGLGRATVEAAMNVFTNNTNWFDAESQLARSEGAQYIRKEVTSIFEVE